MLIAVKMASPLRVSIAARIEIRLGAFIISLAGRTAHTIFVFGFVLIANQSALRINDNARGNALSGELERDSNESR